MPQIIIPIIVILITALILRLIITRLSKSKSVSFASSIATVFFVLIVSFFTYFSHVQAMEAKKQWMAAKEAQAEAQNNAMEARAAQVRAEEVEAELQKCKGEMNEE